MINFMSLLPAEVDSIDRERRIARVRIPGLTDGAAELPEAEFCNPVGDKSEHTEIRIVPGDRVWLAFQNGDTRYPVIMGYRPKNESNGIDWRRFHHDNFQYDADAKYVINAGSEVIINAGAKVTIIAPQVLIDSPETTITGNLTVKKKVTFQGGMAGSGGSGATVALTGNVIVTGGDVTVDGIGVKSHHHTAQGANADTSNAKP